VGGGGGGSSIGTGQIKVTEADTSYIIIMSLFTTKRNQQTCV